MAKKRVVKPKTIVQQYQDFEKDYPPFRKPVRRKSIDVLLDRWPWDKSAREFIAEVEAVVSEAEASGKYESIHFADSGILSYDGVWYDLVGTRVESDEEYEARCREARDTYEYRKQEERETLTQEFEKLRSRFNRLAEELGTPTMNKDGIIGLQ